VLPEQRRRAEMAYLTFSKIAPEDFDRALTSLSQLLRAFGTDVELLSPGLSSRASAALHKLTLPAFRPWVKNSALSPVVHLSITPHAQTDSINDGPLAFISPTHGGRYALFARTSKGGDQQSVVGTRPVTSLEAAADVAFGRFKLYGSIGTLPGQDPTMMILRPDGTGKAMLGLQVDVLQIRDLGISGIFEFHIMRSGDPTNLDTNTGAVGGVGLNW
ncbi:MAG TPA: hypothetical protein VHV83_16195, partial [Armatimonadota bacterium]|nr:hypothetical protein [Armatimonadota bacterium]